MYPLTTRLKLFIFAILCLAGGATAAPLALQYDWHATNEWTDALPVGNGRLGGMIHGAPAREHIQFNEDSLWKGEPHDYSHPGAVDHLPEIRKLILDGKQEEAERVIGEHFLSQPLRQMPYQPFGDVYIEFPGHENATGYRRALDLDQALATVQYTAGGVQYTREIFSSAPHQVMVVRLTADRPGSLTFNATQGTVHENVTVAAQGEDRLVLAGQLPSEYPRRDGNHVFENPTSFESQLEIRAEGGTVSVTDAGIAVQGADSATLLLAARTSFVDFQRVDADPHARCEADLMVLRDVGFDDLRQSHINDYQRLFNRVAIDLGESSAEQLAMNTNERLKAFKGGNDPDLAELYYQYGRYLLISSSRPGSMPANLQGIWNKEIEPPWEGKYTVNINAEMNYWPAEQTNLAECHEPFFDMIEDLVVTGRKVARVHYGARGWIVHHNTDQWRAAAGINNPADGVYMVAAAWLCQHLWWHYEYGGDKVFLAERAYPIMREAALFYEDFLIEDPRPGGKYLITVPSMSPEHGGITAGVAMDNQILRYFFRSCIQAAEELGVDSDLRAKWAEIVGKLPPDQIGRFGQLQEWLEDKDQENDQHRHVSHLWALFPGEEINRNTPELFEAARVVLTHRGDAGTGWSKAWKVNFWARMLDGDHAYLIFEGLIDRSTYNNMFDKHAPFQIDGNFGGTSGITQMLLQSHSGEIVLLPALPSKWANGSVRGLRARGGLEVDVKWTQMKATGATLRADQSRTIKLRAPAGQLVSSVLEDGEPISLNRNAEGMATFAVRDGRVYTIEF